MNNEDLSNIINKFNNSNNLDSFNNISPEMIDNLMNMINNSNNSNLNKSSNQKTNNENSSHNTNNTQFNSNDIDIETILKMKKIIDKMNIKDDPRSNLLKSLKPYLNENRKSKIDQYIQLINMSKVMDVFPFIGGDKKNNG